jgi:MAGUK p55 subfamily protein 5
MTGPTFQRLMADSGRFSAAIPHTSRTRYYPILNLIGQCVSPPRRREEELDGADYHFISRIQFEQDILARKFVEHGEYEKAYYGTSLGAIRSVVNSEKICVLNLHPQSLKILKSSDLMPYVVFVAPPSLQQVGATERWLVQAKKCEGCRKVRLNEEKSE